MLKTVIEVKQTSKGRCEVSNSMTGEANMDECQSMARALGILMGVLQQTAPEISTGLYESFSDGLKKTLGVEE